MTTPTFSEKVKGQKERATAFVSKLDLTRVKHILLIIGSAPGAVGKTMIAALITELLSVYASNVLVMDADLSKAKKKVRLEKLFATHENVIVSALGLSSTLLDQSADATSEALYWGKVPRNAVKAPFTILDLGANIITNFAKNLELSLSDYYEDGILPILILPIAPKGTDSDKAEEGLRLFRTVAPDVPVVLIRNANSSGDLSENSVHYRRLRALCDKENTLDFDLPFCASGGTTPWNAMEHASLLPSTAATMRRTDLLAHLQVAMKADLKVSSDDDTTPEVLSREHVQLLQYNLAKWLRELEGDSALPTFLAELHGRITKNV